MAGSRSINTTATAVVALALGTTAAFADTGDELWLQTQRSPTPSQFCFLRNIASSAHHKP